jgi:hypothetical protein
MREFGGQHQNDGLRANYSAYMPSLEAARIVSDKVVRDIVERWAERENQVPNIP